MGPQVVLRATPAQNHSPCFDPLRLMSPVRITEQTTMCYVTAAHPERTTKLPR